MDWADAALVVTLAFTFDRACGELPEVLHPVVGMGTLIAFFERRAPRRGPWRAGLVGAAIVAALILLVASLAVAAQAALHRLWGDGVLTLLVEALLLSTTFSVRALGRAVCAVSAALSAGDVEGARGCLRALCSRDASKSSPPQLSGAAIESAAENASDGFVAPLLFYSLGGLPAAFAYRAINTLDSMLGYRGELEHLGKAAARLDDVANWVPARITALLLLMAAPWAAWTQRRRALRIWWRDARLTQSPNAGHPMAMMAGLLSVRLDKAGAYRLGAEFREPSALDVTAAWRIVSRASWLSWAACIGGLWLTRYGALP